MSMIIRNRPTLLQLFFIHRGAILPQVLPELLLVFTVATLVLLGLQAYGLSWLEFSPAPFTLLGVGLSIFLSFRNNACYDRWWEARRQWGQMLVTIRSLARQLQVIADTRQRETLLRQLMAFAPLLVARLRRRDKASIGSTYLPPDLLRQVVHAANPPEFLLQRIETGLIDAYRQQQIDSMLYPYLSQRLQELCSVQTACDRINTTPLPFAYTLLLHRSAHLFCFLLPFGLAQSMGWLTPFFAALVAYTFFGLDALGDQLENPFGEDENDLALDAMTRNLEIELRESLGETDLPPRLEPVNYILL